MNLFDQYGIKEVADVTIYSIHKKEDGSGEVYYVPALYLDTLKVTTTEKTAENTWAQGGLGNSRLISWDYGKTINLTLEDALCTPASLGLCWGGILGADWKDAQVNHTTGIQSLDCAMERISRMEKAFYPRNDTVNAVVSNLLPRDPANDIIYTDDANDPVYLSRSSVLDGTVVKGFGYVDSKPYKWNLEIESEVKSVAVVPDRFFSIYGKSYPIKRRQTVGINQPSESFKYEIVYLRGYDKYDDEDPCAKIIYHKQTEQGEEISTTCAVGSDSVALRMLANADDFPYLKIRVCWDGSIKTYLGGRKVEWGDGHEEYKQVTTDTNDTTTNTTSYGWVSESSTWDTPITTYEQAINAPQNGKTNWFEVPQINADQFRNIDLWVRFDSINALSYYLLTKYENNIFSISAKQIDFGLQRDAANNLATEASVTWKDGGGASAIKIKAGTTYIKHFVKDGSIIKQEKTVLAKDTFVSFYNTSPLGDESSTFKSKTYYGVTGEYEAIARVISEFNLTGDKKVHTDEDGYDFDFDYSFCTLSNVSWDTVVGVAGSSGPVATLAVTDENVIDVVGLSYSLDDPLWTIDACTPCCKKDNLSRAIWAYVNPKTMTPYDDDYWFHQGEPYYKKSLTLSTKENPLKAQKIYVEQGTFPGMYKIVCETLIRERDTGEDQRVQISLPLCKIKSDQTLTLQADGDPTTFNLDVEVATPQNGVPMEITFYEVEKDMKTGCSGKKVPKDGSTKISAK